MSESIFEIRGVDVDALPLCAGRQIPTVLEKDLENPGCDQQYLDLLARSQPWSVVDRSELFIADAHRAIFSLANHAKYPGFAEAKENALASLPEMPADYLNRYFKFGKKVMDAMNGKNDMSLTEFVNNAIELRSEVQDILLSASFEYEQNIDKLP